MSAHANSRLSRGAVVISGANSGIGAATTRRLTDAGYLVFAGVRRSSQGEQLRQSTADDASVIPILLDVTDEAAIADAAAQVEQTLQDQRLRLAGVVNNAADENLGPVEILPVDVFRREMEVGFLGMVALTKAFLARLRSEQGRVINLSSVNGLCTFKYHATTCATKYAVEAFSDALRMEMKPWRVSVSIIEPGPTNTPLMVEKTVAEFREKLARYPIEERERYFPDFEQTVEKVESFVNRIRKPVGGWFSKARRLLNGDGWLHAPDEVAAAIEHALTSRRPRTRYLIGAQAKSIYLLRRLLRDRRFDRMLGERVFDF